MYDKMKIHYANISSIKFESVEHRKLRKRHTRVLRTQVIFYYALYNKMDFFVVELIEHLL